MSRVTAIAALLAAAPVYHGTKQVKAVPMTRGGYNNFRGWDAPEGEAQNVDGYLVEYLDGGAANVEGIDNYVSWSPLDVFERSYQRAANRIDRMAIELKELQARLRALGDFMQSEPYGALPDHEKALLGAQHGAMLAYEGVLVVRFNLALGA